MMNIWHDIDDDRIYPTDFVSVIEISKGSNMKYELDKKTGMLALDRVLFTATYYPMNYGFIPRTYGDDHDPLDVLLLCSQPIQPMTIVRSYPIGVMYMEDSGMGDEKIIAIPYGDPTYMNYTDIKELPKHILKKSNISFLFTNSLKVNLRPSEILAVLWKLLLSLKEQLRIIKHIFVLRINNKVVEIC